MNKLQFLTAVWQRLTVQYGRSLMASVLALRLAVTPIFPAAVSVLAVEKPALPEPSVTLSLRQAPVELFTADKTFELKIGESAVEREARLQREAEEARRRAAEQALVDTVNRNVLSRGAADRQNGGLSPDRARDLTVQYAAQYGVDPVLMSKIIVCESGYNQFAKNSRSTASGYGQFLAGTWRSTIAQLGWDPAISPFDGERNLQATAYLLSKRGTSPWNASAACWRR